ncbi:MAG: 1-acyl-sn-glycerol-3-phosphate acyltransferase [Chitinispirillaceae bacterium]|nr:1-acyl-sn-glycerol-3-phosphate acyltransferase [Chitinispirillaceae bacterium]
MNSYHKAVANVVSEVRTFFSKTFSEVHIEGPDLDPAVLNQSPLMLVSTHRSHADYFMLGYIFHLAGFNTLRFAAGDNLTKLPWIGPRFTSFGSFTVERDTGFNRHYVRDLCYRVVKMIEDGETVLVFPEGGRSYSGAMLDIKTGILGASIISQAKDLSRDVRYIPVAISYEYAPDIPWFSMQQTGKKWRKKSNFILQRLIGNLQYFGADAFSFIPFLFAQYFRPKSYGVAYVDYGEPVSLKSIVDVAAGRIENARDEFSSHRNNMQQLSDAVFRHLLRLYRVLPMHVVAAHLSEHGKASTGDLAAVFPSTIETLRKNDRNVKQLENNSPEHNAEEGIRQLLRIKAVAYRNTICTVRKKALVDYYAATLS